MKKPDKPAIRREDIEEKVEQIERGVLNAFRVKRNTGLADGAGAPGSTAAGDERAGLPDADADRGRRD
jgi:hypothetical protein